MGNLKYDLAFSAKLAPAAERIYHRVFPGCDVLELRPESGERVHTLDKHFGVDKKIVLPCGTCFLVQEKYRRFDAWNDSRLRVKRFTPDFTQEYKNASGTEFEADGEWANLAADLYFYGWSTVDESDFIRWIILNVPTYKHLVHFAGGLGKIGQYHQNSTHGRASFYAIPMTTLRPAWMFSGNATTVINWNDWNVDDTGDVVFSNYISDVRKRTIIGRQPTGPPRIRAGIGDPAGGAT